MGILNKVPTISGDKSSAVTIMQEVDRVSRALRFSLISCSLFKALILEWMLKNKLYLGLFKY